MTNHTITAGTTGPGKTMTIEELRTLASKIRERPPIITIGEVREFTLPDSASN